MEIKVYPKDAVMAQRIPVSTFMKKNETKYFIYFLIQHEDVVYVGKSINPDNRIRTHVMENRKEFDSYTVFECDTEAEMDMMENVHIVAYQPLHNKAISMRKIGEGIRDALEKEKVE